MRCERQGELEALGREELDEAGMPAAEGLRAHLAACPSCAEEARWLAAERQLFAQRSAVAAAPPPFAAVMARARGGDVREDRARAARRARVGVILAAAAALLGFFVTHPGARSREVATEIVAEPAMELSCFEGQPIAVELEAFVTDRAIASVEDQYGACMLATPLARSARGDAACAAPVDHAVTCDPLGPSGSGAVE